MLARHPESVHGGGVSFDEVPAAAERWLALFGLPVPPPAGGKDLRGQRVRLCASQDDETMRFFFPRRSIPFSNRMIKEVAATLRRRGAKIDRVDLNIEAYARWLDGLGKRDTEELRYEFATKLPAH